MRSGLLRRTFALRGETPSMYVARGIPGFSHMDGIKRGSNEEFDAFVEAKRRERGFEEFDQRVERAYTVALKTHKAEIWNGVKRRLKRTGDKYSPELLIETNRQIEERTQWLRDVFAQIDSDYRSNDETRQAAAAADITKALEGAPFDFMATVYERKGERRLKGAKGAALMDTENENMNMPEISDDEANRYLNLKPKLADLEAALKERYGVTGDRHWAYLQSLKDSEYLAKLDKAADVYKELTTQQEAALEAVESGHSKRLIARITAGQIRFQTAMELEEERLKIIEARSQMDQERYEAAKRRRRKALERAADWRNDGVSEAEIARRLKEETWDRVVMERGMYGKQERQKVAQRKRAFLTLVDEMESRFEARDGERQMQKDGGSAAATTARPRSQFSKEAEEEISAALAAARKLAGERVLAEDQTREEKDAARLRREAQTVMSASRDPSKTEEKRALWDVVNEDSYQDPFLVIHQARLDARKTYTDLYAHVSPFLTKLAKKNRTQGDGMDLAGGDRLGEIYKKPHREYMTYGWGMHGNDVANLDQDPNRKYVQSEGRYFVKNEETGAIDLTYEKKAGRGLRWTGPRFYKLGVDEDFKDHPKEQSALAPTDPRSSFTGYRRPSPPAKG